MEQQETNTVGDETVNWLIEQDYHSIYEPDILKEIANKINEIIHTRVIQLLQENNTKR